MSLKHTVLMHKQTLPLCTYGCFYFSYSHNSKNYKVTRSCVFCAHSDLHQLPTANQDATLVTSVRFRAASGLVVARQPLIKWISACVWERCKICVSRNIGLYSSSLIAAYFGHVLWNSYFTFDSHFYPKWLRLHLTYASFNWIWFNSIWMVFEEI